MTLWCSAPRLDITTAPRISLIATGLGIVYGLLGLEVVSPLVLLLVIGAGMILFLAWRLPADFMAMAAAGVGFVCGFGIVWAVALGRLIATCTPPACQTADPTTELLYALALVVPLMTLAGAEIGLREWLGRG
jgi:hypothetical protein